MNIAKDLGNLISGLFAPQASSSVRRVEQEGTSRSRTTPREPAGSREKSTSTQASDRLTLSSESISLAYDARELTASTVTTTTHSTADPSQRLALPYSPSTTGPPLQQTVEESPATRELVRTNYGSSDSSNASETFAPPKRIDFHA